MLKNFLKFSLGAITIIAFGVALYFASSYYKEWKNKESISQQQKPDEIIITKLPNGEQLVENKTEGFKTEIPIGLEINKTPVNYHLKAFTPEGSKTEMVYQIDKYDNPSNLQLENWLRKHRNITTLIPIKIGQIDGLSYSNHIFQFDDITPIENSEEFRVDFIKDNKIIELTCSAAGLDYKSEIERCKNKIFTFSFIQ